MCLVCNKTRSHVMHEGQGTADPGEYQEDPASEQEADQRAAEEYQQGHRAAIGGALGAVTLGQIRDMQEAQTYTPPENYFRIESNGSTTQIEISIPDGDRSMILQALLEFMERIKEVPVDQVPTPEPKKGKK